MTYESYYGNSLIRLQQAERLLTGLLENYAEQYREEGSLYTVQSIISRIKAPESMVRKLESRGLPTDSETALTRVHDALGLRVICSFTAGVYHLARWIREQSDLELIQIKDYIAYPKPNGYRSYHLILRLKNGSLSGIFAEIQIRTLAQDFWGSLEHQIKYKHQIPQEALIHAELKHCADEIASVDLTLQTIQELLKSGELST